MMFDLQLNDQIRQNTKLLTLGTLAIISLIGMILLIHFTKGVPVGNLTRDPNAIGGILPYSGFLSQLGIFIWSSAATICFLNASLYTGKSKVGVTNEFWILSGSLLLMLGFDDVFMLHEAMFPWMGMPEKVVLASYVAFMMFYIVRLRKVLLASSFVLFFFGLFCFGCSVIIDLIEPDGQFRVLYEDGFKSAGQIYWLLYFFSVHKENLHTDQG